MMAHPGEEDDVPTVLSRSPEAVIVDVPRVLPRGRHSVRREIVLASQRGRLLDAIAEAVAEKGYPATTVGDVVARAGVSRKTFYEHFDDKLDCFLAAFDAGVDALLGRLSEAWELPGDVRTRMRREIEAYLEWLASAPQLARTFLVEALAAGPRVLERRAAVHARFAAQLQAAHAEARAELPDLAEVPPELFIASVGAVDELVTERVRQGRADSLPQLADVILHIQLALLGRTTT
jgi:AcrR family transcriptional regulator